MIYFIDDMNLPKQEDFGTQNSLSLLRMVMDTGTLFDRSDFGVKKEIIDVQYMAAVFLVGNVKTKRNVLPYACH